MASKRVVVIGGGVGGLVSAAILARRGLDVTILERASAPGGKMREVEAGGARIDAGPTVLTMRWVFDEIFREAGSEFAREITLRPLSILARHAWSAQERLDLFSDVERTVDAIGSFAGAREANGYREFTARSRAVYRTLEGPFIRSSQPTPISLSRRAGLSGLGDLWRISPFTTLWRALGDHFKDQRLRQLFARYATYCGSSPFLSPATLMLVAHVEQEGVWTVEGGMHHLAATLARLAEANGARIIYGAEAARVEATGTHVTAVITAAAERFPADAVIVNADAAAIAAGLFGPAVKHTVAPVQRRARSLSALTWCINAETSGFPLVRHNVFFSSGYETEFDEIVRRDRLPSEPTVYVCAQDRIEDETGSRHGPERLLCLVNAPPSGDHREFTKAEIEQCEEQTFTHLSRLGLRVARTSAATVVTTPADFNRLCPATGGALYGQASHGWMTSFSRPEARTKVAGLYLAGGSVHPGPGVPMAAISGYLAAASLIADLSSPRRSHTVVMPGGTSTR